MPKELANKITAEHAKNVSVSLREIRIAELTSLADADKTNIKIS